MANEFTTTTNMELPVPIATTTTGPEYADDLNQCLQQIDQHDHTTGRGVPINPAGISINADLPFTSDGIFYNATSLRSVRFNSNPSPLAQGADIGCVYVSGVDLYYNDSSGNQIRMTQSGSIAGSPGSITGLTPPANVTYTSVNQTFTFQSSTATPAALDIGPLTLRNIVANSPGITLSPPAALPSNYTLTFPNVLPSTGSILRVDPSGNISATLRPDGSTIIIASSALGVRPGGISYPQLAPLTRMLVTTSNQAVAATTASIIFTTVVRDTASAYSNVTGIYTIPSNGTYLINASVQYDGASVGDAAFQALYLYKNQVVLRSLSWTNYENIGGSQPMANAGTCMDDFVTGDLITVRALNNTGAAQLNNDGASNYFAITQIGRI